MTLPEFRAWLEGYENSFPTQLDIITERMIPVPTPEQWAEVKAKLASVGMPHNLYAPAQGNNVHFDCQGNPMKAS